MAKIKVFYEYDQFQDGLAPIWYVLQFGITGMDWTKQTVYISLSAPFEKQDPEEFHDDIIGMTIEMADLVRNEIRPKQFGILLPYVKARAERLGYDISDIKQFIIQVSDIEEVMQMTLFRD